MKSNEKIESSEDQSSWMRRLWRAVQVPLVSVFLALFIGALLIISSGVDPLNGYWQLFLGAFGSLDDFAQTLEKATPLLFAGLAVSFAFKAGLFNIGAQGQLIFGAVISAGIGFGITGLPPTVHMVVALLGGAVAGALFGMIPGVLKVASGAHEVITTILLNYIAIKFAGYLANGPWQDTSSQILYARTPEILESAVIPDIVGLPVGFFIAMAVALLVWWVLNKTTLGFEIRTAGMNPNAAKYAGIKVSRTIVITMILSGLLAGFGGAVETLGVVGKFEPAFNQGLGFDGITVALLAKTNPLGTIVAALLMGALQAGASEMQHYADVQPKILDVIQALMLFFVAADVLVRKLIRAKEDDDAGVSLTKGWG